jgi:hypothetical protein
MTKITVADTLVSQLEELTETAELCDASGRVLGRFLPGLDHSAYEPDEPQVREEELDRREQETESYTTAEVLAYLEKL